MKHKKYLNILCNYKKPIQQFTLKFKCKGCSNTESFTTYSGYNMCYECGTLNGHILGQFDVKELSLE